MDRDGHASTATQADTDRMISRRGVMRVTAIGIGATAAGGVGTKYAGSPVGEAEAVAPLIAAGAIGLAAGAVGAVAFGGDFLGPDEQDVADSLAWQDYVDEYTNLLERNLMLDQTIASLERDIQLVENKAREDAIFAIYEQGVDSGSESDATAAAEAAIGEAYATVEKALLNSWTIRFNSFKTAADAYMADQDIGSITNADGYSKGGYHWDDSASSTTGILYNGDSETASETLLNGEDHSYTRMKREKYYSNSTTYTYGLLSPTLSDWDKTKSDGDGIVYGYDMLAPDANNYDSVDTQPDFDTSSAKVIDSKRWKNLHQEIIDAHDTIIGEVSAMVDSYYQPAVDGEIDLIDAVGPKHLTDTASTAEDYQEATMALRGMGYPISEQVVTIEVPTEDDEGMELTGRLAWTAHSGNTLAIGQTHFAENIPGSVFAAVNLPDGVDSLDGNTTDTNTTNTTDDGSTDTGPGAEIVELTDEFDILSAEGADGVSFEDRTLASADNITNEEINQIFKDNYDANQEATETVHETATGGGGSGFLDGFGGDTQTLGIVAGGAALAALLFGR